MADTYTGLHGLVGLLAALHHARETGEGQHVDLAMINALMFTDDYAHFILEDSPIVSGGGQIFDATGGPIILAGDEKWWWRVLNTRGGVQDPTPPGADLETKIASRRQAITEFLNSFEDRRGLLARLDELNLAWGDVYDHREVFDKQRSIKAREILTEIDDRGGGTRRITQTPYKFSSAEAGVRGPAAYRGEHNYTALQDWLGVDRASVEQLHNLNVLCRRRRRPSWESRREVRDHVRQRRCVRHRGGGRRHRHRGGRDGPRIDLVGRARRHPRRLPVPLPLQRERSAAARRRGGHPRPAHLAGLRGRPDPPDPPGDGDLDRPAAQPARAGQGVRLARPALRWALRAGHRRRLAGRGVPGAGRAVRGPRRAHRRVLRGHAGACGARRRPATTAAT